MHSERTGGGTASTAILILRSLLWALAWLILSLGIAWAVGALWFDLPVCGHWIAGLFFLAALAGFVFAKCRWRLMLRLAAAVSLTAAWWLMLKPSNDRNWQPDVSRTAWAEVNGDTVTFHNVRNFDYHAGGTNTPQWDTRTVQLSKITGVDLAVNYWGSEWMAHPIFSFQFADAPPLCFSVEIRKQEGESYSALGGLFRQYELIYIVADERDVLRVRTNYRSGEDIYLYHMTFSPEKARRMLLEYVAAINDLQARPRWYNAVTANCTTSVYAQRETGDRTPWDWRILLNGKGDELMYERRLIESCGLPFAELKQRSLIDDRARAADQDPQFPLRIREGLPVVKKVH